MVTTSFFWFCFASCNRNDIKAENWHISLSLSNIWKETDDVLYICLASKLRWDKSEKSKFILRTRQKMEWAILWYQATAYTTFVSWEIAAWEKKTCWMSSYHKVVIICANSMRKNGFCAQLKSAFLLYWRIVNFLKLLFFILKPKDPYIFTWFFKRCSLP